MKTYLQSMSVDEVNWIEPDGSTALHAAARRGHEKVVQLLLEKGADYSIIDVDFQTSLDVAKTDATKQLIQYYMSKRRFVSDSIEWVLVNGNADYQAKKCWEKLHSFGEDPHFYRLITCIRQTYLERELQNISGVDQIKEYFDKAITERDPSFLLTAYTSETGFYSALNVHLAKLRLENITDQTNISLAYYVGIIARHPKFASFSYVGRVFRGMMITSHDLKQYTTGTRILTKTFLSTSTERNVAVDFLGVKHGTNDRLRVICTYEIHNRRTALDIQQFSSYPGEKEVLVMPYSAFKIMSVQRNEQLSNEVEIQLEECKPW